MSRNLDPMDGETDDSREPHCMGTVVDRDGTQRYCRIRAVDFPVCLCEGHSRRFAAFRRDYKQASMDQRYLDEANGRCFVTKAFYWRREDAGHEFRVQTALSRHRTQREKYIETMGMDRREAIDATVRLNKEVCAVGGDDWEKLFSIHDRELERQEAEDAERREARKAAGGSPVDDADDGSFELEREEAYRIILRMVWKATTEHPLSWFPGESFAGERPDPEEKYAILRRSMDNALSAVSARLNGDTAAWCTRWLLRMNSHLVEMYGKCERCTAAATQFGLSDAVDDMLACALAKVRDGDYLSMLCTAYRVMETRYKLFDTVRRSTTQQTAAQFFNGRRTRPNDVPALHTYVQRSGIDMSEREKNALIRDLMNRECAKIGPLIRTIADLPPHDETSNTAISDAIDTVSKQLFGRVMRTLTRSLTTRSVCNSVVMAVTVTFLRITPVGYAVGDRVRTPNSVKDKQIRNIKGTVEYIDYNNSTVAIRVGDGTSVVVPMDDVIRRAR